MEYPTGAVRTVKELAEQNRIEGYTVFVCGDQAHNKVLLNKAFLSVRKGELFTHTGGGSPWNPQYYANLDGESPIPRYRKDFLFLNYWHAYAYKKKLEHELGRVPQQS